MKRVVVLCLSVMLVGFTLAGCKEEMPATPADTGQVRADAPIDSLELASYRCPGCGAEMEADAYCTHCNAVASTGATVHCDKCDKDYTEGQYCPECNRFMFDDPYFCATENRTFPKGTYCPKEAAYQGVTTVEYCAECKKPFDGALEKCPDCGK